MRPLRVPMVAGTAGGVGTSTVAAALHALDAGCVTAAADILVCRADVESLQTALAGPATPGNRPPPVLAVNSGPVPEPAVSLLDPLSTRYTAVIVLPEVRLWRGIDVPRAVAAGTLAQDPTGLPRGLRRYATGLRAVAAAVSSSGLLDEAGPTDGPPARPRVDLRLWIGLTGIEHTVPAGEGEPDDLGLDPSSVPPSHRGR